MSRLLHRIFRESVLHLVCHTEFFKSQSCNEIEKIEMKNISSLNSFFARNKSRRNYHVSRLSYRIHRESVLQRNWKNWNENISFLDFSFAQNRSRRRKHQNDAVRWLDIEEKLIERRIEDWTRNRKLNEKSKVERNRSRQRKHQNDVVRWLNIEENVLQSSKQWLYKYSWKVDWTRSRKLNEINHLKKTSERSRSMIRHWRKCFAVF